VLFAAAFALAHTLLAILWFDILSGSALLVVGLASVIVYGVLLAYVHEGAHFVAAKLAGAQDVKLHASTKGFSVTYALHDFPLRLLAISLAGPLSGVVYGTLGLIAAGSWQQAHPVWATWVAMISIIACLQAVLLLPFVADGNMFWTSLWNIIMRKKGTS